MNSMTGFGKAEISFGKGSFVVEISSVNSRYLEISARLPRGMAVLEPQMKELISGSVNRGKLNVWVGFEESSNDPARFAINRTALRSYHEQLSKLARELKISSDISISDMLSLPDIAADSSESIDLDDYWPPLEKAARRAVKQLTTMRRKEGLAMKADMTSRLAQTEKSLKQVTSLTGNMLARKREKLASRIDELAGSVSVDPIRIEEEIAIMAERMDISEECIRLASHIKLFKSTLKLGEPVGKRLNFILQEMNREANTIAAKASDFDISSAVINIKEEVERIREMVQNVE